MVRFRLTLFPSALFGAALVAVVLSSASRATVLHVPGDYPTIQAAIDAAVTADTVEVACGTYEVTEIQWAKSGITLRSATGEPDCVTLTPPPPQAQESRRIMDCTLDATSVIEGITFYRGDSNGGGFYCTGSPTITKCNFVLNSGAAAPRAKTTVTVPAPPHQGGDLEGAVNFENSNSVITDCLFQENSAAGGVVTCAGGFPTFVRCQFTGNRASDFYGAIGIDGGEFVDCVFSANSAYFGGGAVDCRNTTFRSCVFYNNVAGRRGGAALARATTFEGCVFYGNSAGYQSGDPEAGGGAIRADGTYPVTIRNCTFSGNLAPPRLASSKVAPPGKESVAADDDARGNVLIVGDNASVILDHVIAFANGDDEAIVCYGSATVTVTCSDIHGRPGGDWVDCIAGQLGVNGNISVDPLFCNAAGGDFHLSSLSPCLYQECGLMGALGQGCFDELPALYDVHDVGNDQGRQVRLLWQRSLYDAPADGVDITGYEIYRRRDAFAAASAEDHNIPLTAPDDRPTIPGWDYLATVPAHGDSVYQYVAPTLCDSTITSGMCWSVFFVSAVTPDPFVFYYSPPDSGYSKDNIPPPVPSGFAVAYNTGSGNHLTWDAVAAGDFASFRVYRSTQPNFVPSPSLLVKTTTQTSWTDPQYDGWNVHYGVTSVDLAGNESQLASPGSVTSVPTDVVPKRLELYPNAPNPFNPTTRITFATPSSGRVRVAIYDARGRLVRVLVERDYPAGRHGIVWDGRDSRGLRVSSGVYLCRLEQGSETRSRKVTLLQ